MKTGQLSHVVLIVPALLLGACATDMPEILSDAGARSRAIETLVGDASMRGEVMDRLLSDAPDRSALFQRILEDDEAAGTLIGELMQTERGKSLIAGQVAADGETTRSFMTMLMSTGALGEILTQDQAELLDLGEAFALGNQMRTMIDLKRLGERVDDWARRNDGSYPACGQYDDVTGCLASRLPAGALTELRLTDAWGRPFRYHSDDAGRSYLLISYATDGVYDRLGRVGPTSSHDADIVYSDGDFVQWPGRIRKDAIR
jgi:hypothetical protein